MSEALPRLRFNLDFLPSTDSAKPGLYIRDPYHYSDATLLIPPPLLQALECFDGQQTAVDLRAELVRITGEIQTSELEQHLFDSLNEAGFLENDIYLELKRKREAEFAEEPVREAAFAGSAYPEEPIELSDLLSRHIGTSTKNSIRNLVGIAAPHASPDGGWDTYRAAFGAISHADSMAERTFVVLGTSHYGAPDAFGLTRKRFITPFGQTQSVPHLVESLEKAAPKAVRSEDYCHAVEHSIEFQVVFLQYLFGPRIKVLPILCGPFVKSLYEGGLPEANENVARFFDALSEMREREGNGLFWVLGVDMAHMGQRYGDNLRATANIGEMQAIEARDRERIVHIGAGRIADYWSLVQENQDDLKWCGAAPFYTFLKVLPEARGQLLSYQQWQIDVASVVSFGALAFNKS